jgi:hypothetical protein
MLKEAVPSTAKAAFLGMRGGWEGSSGQVLRKPATAWEFPWFGCHSLGMEMFVINAGSEREIDTAFATMDQHRAARSSLLLTRSSSGGVTSSRR